ERGALMDLYHATHGPAWTRRNSWGTSAPLGDWFGVTVDRGVVVKLALPCNNLRGSIPPS
ncbi:hypothetical protein B484DRAFT_301306, partial [Ochromonadaceae sp. CCMP2298]